MQVVYELISYAARYVERCIQRLGENIIGVNFTIRSKRRSYLSCSIIGTRPDSLVKGKRKRRVSVAFLSGSISSLGGNIAFALIHDYDTRIYFPRDKQ